MTSEPEKRSDLPPASWKRVQAAWNTCESLPPIVFTTDEAEHLLARLSSPVSGTDMVIVPREPTEAMLKEARETEYWDTPTYVRAIWSAMLSASPSTPIPVIAEAERQS